MVDNRAYASQGQTFEDTRREILALELMKLRSLQNLVSSHQRSRATRGVFNE